jgi:shikimate kinase
MTRSDRQIVLIGVMGAGKSTIGKRLAARLGWEFWDNDEALRAATGLTAAEVQDEEGQAELHQHEKELLRGALSRPEAMVLAAAGSVVLEPELVAGVLTVWLRISTTRWAEHLAHSGQHHRPLPADPHALLRQIASEREPLYARVADVSVDVADDPAATFALVVNAVTAYPGTPGAIRALLEHGERVQR